MDQPANKAEIIAPAQMAHLRAKLYAQRGVTNREAALLLEAYDDLVRRFTSALDEPGAAGRVHPVVPAVARAAMPRR